MGKSLDANHAGALHALQQQANTVLNVTTKEDVDRLGTDGSVNDTTVAGFNHHEKKFVVRAADYYRLAYPTDVAITLPSPVGHVVNAVDDFTFTVKWNRPTTFTGATPQINLTLDNATRAIPVTAGNTTAEWTCNYSTVAADYANTTGNVTMADSNIALNGSTITDEQGRSAGLDFVVPSRLSEITVGD